MTAGRRTEHSAAAPRVRRWRSVAACLVFLVVLVVCAGACGTNAVQQLGPTGDPALKAVGCSPGAQGCPCTTEGATFACGKVESQSGNYVTCSMGFSTCTAGLWGACVGNRLITKSRPDVALTSRGIKVLSVPLASCPNVCDPNGCMATQGGPDDVDASGFAASDGGISLQDGTLPLDGGCVGLACDIASCAGNVTTTLSGTVYDPAGNNPLYGAEVYIPANPAQALPAFSTGASCDTCSGAGSLDAIQATQTDAAGNFTLTNVPTLANLPVVVQLGKWRREIQIKTIASCQGNAVAGNCTTPNPADCVFRLPRNQNDGYDPVAGTYTKADLPLVAIITGKSDPFDCLMLKAGIDPHEFSDYMSTKRMHFYRADGTAGGDSLDPAYGANYAGSTLWNNLSSGTPAMSSYDVILLPCEGGANDHQTGGNSPYQNLISYVDNGGRAFTTHFGYSWLEYPAGKSYVPAPDNWSSLANWSPTGAAMTSTVDTQDPLTGIVNTGFPKGAIYSQWLQNLGATNTPSQLAIHEGRQDLTTIGKDAQSWMTAHDTKYPTAPDYTNLFTFNTPLGAAANAQCGRVVYSDFHVSASAQVSGTQCITNVDCGFTSTCQGATAGATGTCNEPCGSSADCPNAGYACAGSAIGTCDQTACRGNGDCPSGHACVNGACACLSNSECSGTCSATTCSPVSCISNAQCGKGTCGGGSCGTTAVLCHKAADCGLGTCGGPSHQGKCRTTGACHENSDCGIGGTCGTGTGSAAGTCATSGQACHSNVDCDSSSCGAGIGSAVGACGTNGQPCATGADCDSGTCNLAGVCTSRSCAGDAACSVSTTCNGAKCSTDACHVDTDCHVDGSTCHGAKCSRSNCNGDSDCPVGLCTGASCTPPPACATNADCGTTGRCTGTMCSANACASGADCGAGSLCGGSCIAPTCAQNSDCASGVCNGGICGCTSNENCGGGQTCQGAVSGTCSRACTQNSDCAPDLCVNGQCGGCTNSSQCHDSGYEAQCGGIPAGNYGHCTPSGASQFPEACRQGTLSSQEKALEFMFFDLTSCVSPDNATPSPPTVDVTGYPPATFTVDFEATACPPQTLPVWREFDWQAQIPTGANIVFSAQSGPTTASLLPPTPLLLATATTPTDTGPMMQNYDVALLDDGTGTKGAGAFNTAMPPVASSNVLRVTITLNPTPDFQQTPTLDQWRVQYDCGASE